MHNYVGFQDSFIAGLTGVVGVQTVALAESADDMDIGTAMNCTDDGRLHLPALDADHGNVKLIATIAGQRALGIDRGAIIDIAAARIDREFGPLGTWPRTAP
jgi:hypothetical protein